MLGMKKSTINTPSNASIKTALMLSLAGLSLTLGACSGHQAKIQPNKPLVQTNQIYYAPAQTYNLDLNSAVLAGKLNLQDSCTPEGNSLSITDQIGRFYRIDAINLNNNPKLPGANAQDTQTLSSQIGQLYAQLYQAQIQPQSQGAVKPVRASLGASGYVVLNQNNQRYIGLLIHKRNDYAYVIQHTQTTYNETTMQQALAQLSRNMQVPGRKIKDSGSEMALSIDLAAASPAQLAAWKKTANCS
jgi:hypothetical protein